MISDEKNIEHLSVAKILARQLETIKLKHRAEKYRYKEDRGGIAYIRKNITKGNIVFDIGAHKAGYLYFFLEQLHGTGRVYAFEPQTILHTYLTRLQQLFLWNNVTIESLAVSCSTGKAFLHIPYNNGKRSSPCATILENDFFSTYQSCEEVNTVSLDDYCLQHEIIPDFLKVDVEGNELSVFMGAEKLLRLFKPKIIVECEARFVGKEKVKETFQFLQNIGYRGYFIMGSTIQPIAGFTVHYHQAVLGDGYCNNFIFE